LDTIELDNGQMRQDSEQYRLVNEQYRLDREPYVGNWAVSREAGQRAVQTGQRAVGWTLDSEQYRLVGEQYRLDIEP
jgi:hypothetical protein